MHRLKSDITKNYLSHPDKVLIYTTMSIDFKNISQWLMRTEKEIMSKLHYRFNFPLANNFKLEKSEYPHQNSTTNILSPPDHGLTSYCFLM